MQEAIWDGKPFSAFMQGLVELEEAKSTFCVGGAISAQTGLSMGRPFTATIPEHARFIDVVVADELNEMGHGTLVCARYRHETDRSIEVIEHQVDLVNSEEGLKLSHLVVV